MKVFNKLCIAIFACGLASSPAMAQFVGGGFVSRYSAACDESNPDVGNRQNFPRIYYSATEYGASVNEITLDFTDGSVTFGRGLVFDRHNGFRRAYGIATFLPGAAFLDPRPRIRVLRRTIVEPQGASFENATQIDLRMRIYNYFWAPGCEAEVIATLGRVNLGGAATAEATLSGTMPHAEREDDFGDSGF